ncbi:TerB family tellurite resistance protein [Flavitalea sp. BT771]|uniref:TerB family tellurite resistance protein n=1 Tax=Flavitalea sp. BT771 TaxID=3063329 RepID=UPI0026E44091|nr:TerB family tellurite resistance protein [Flavitalea sp. BT771]MDO6433048.1 TerB family tellurite resistance protein [Flavitalea sp. BT771]MDV6221676.1 TerB family tellurite resistance protein [Flavitalea sp. BT771]
MKRVALIALLFAGCTMAPCHAQSTADAIKQLLLDVQKLRDLKSILQEMKNGYEILEKGYTEIRNIAKDRFDIHKAFLDGLLVVSPSVRNYHRIGAILDAENNLVREFDQGRRQAYAGGLFTGQELGYFERMYATLYRHSLQSLDELTMVIADGALRMSDAQRLRSIDRVYREINGQLRALRQLNQDTALQAAQRQHEKDELNFLKLWYDNP